MRGLAWAWFKGIPYEHSLVINSARLAVWWEAEAQDYLDAHGFKDR